MPSPSSDASTAGEPLDPPQHPATTHRWRRPLGTALLVAGAADVVLLVWAGAALLGLRSAAQVAAGHARDVSTALEDSDTATALTAGRLAADATARAHDLAEALPLRLASHLPLSGPLLTDARTMVASADTAVDDGRVRLSGVGANDDFTGVRSPASNLGPEQRAYYGDGPVRLTNANLSPDFTVAAPLLVAAWEALGRSAPDAVVALDPQGMAPLLGPGSLEVPGGPAISADTVVDVLLRQACSELADDDGARDRYLSTVVGTVFEQALGGGALTPATLTGVADAVRGGAGVRGAEAAQRRARHRAPVRGEQAGRSERPHDAPGAGRALPRRRRRREAGPGGRRSADGSGRGTVRPVTASEHRTYPELVSALAAAQKTTRGAPLYSRLVNRPLGRRLAALAHLLGATPDQVTAASAVATFAGIAAIALAPEGAWWWGVVVAFLLVLGYALDAADGQLARLRGGGSVAGEWLDHVVDAAKIATIHLAVAIGAWRTGADSPWLLVPLAFSAAASTWFFTIILNDHLSRLAGGRDGQAAVAAGAEGGGSRVLARSLAALPADYGVLCAVFVTLGWPGLFRPLYTLLALGFLLITAASMVAWRRRILLASQSA